MTELAKQPWSPPLDATVRDGVVDLWGVVLAAHQREAAIVAAENIPGVKAVRSHIAWVEPVSGMVIYDARTGCRRLARQDWSLADQRLLRRAAAFLGWSPRRLVHTPEKPLFDLHTTPVTRLRLIDHIASAARSPHEGYAANSERSEVSSSRVCMTFAIPRASRRACADVWTLLRERQARQGEQPRRAFRRATNNRLLDGADHGPPKSAF